MSRRALALLLLLLAAPLSAACGKKGPPSPPEPRGPLPPGQVEARQIGEAALVHFTVPRSRGRKPSQRPARAELLRVDYAPGHTSPPDANAFRLRGRIVGVEEGGVLESGRRVSLADPTISRLPDGGAGWTLRFAVRVRDAAGRPSPLVAARDLVAVPPPPPPRGLGATATADGIRLEWEPRGEPTPHPCNVYRARVQEPFGERPLNTEPIASAELLDGTVQVGASYRYVVRSTAGTGPPYRESESSPEVTIVAEDRFPPAAPTGLVAVQEGSSVRLFWNPNAEKDLAGYRVYRRPGEGEWAEISGDPIRETTFLDRDLPAGDLLEYRATALDTASPPNESEPSSPVRVEVARPRGGEEGS